MRSGLVFDIAHRSICDGPGVRTTVFLSGCPLACWWCLRPEGRLPVPHVRYAAGTCVLCGACVEACPEGALEVDRDRIVRDEARCARCGTCAGACPTGSRELLGRTMSVEEVLAEIDRDRPVHEDSSGGVIFSGGEPMLQVEFLLALLRACGRRGIHRTVATTGLASEGDLERVAAETELFLYDLKAMDPARHVHATGASTRRILANLRRLVALGKEVHARIPLIPGFSDDRENIERAGAFLESLRGVREVTLRPYDSRARDRHLELDLPWRGPSDAPRIAPGRVRELAEVLEDFGLAVRLEPGSRPGSVSRSRGPRSGSRGSVP